MYGSPPQSGSGIFGMEDKTLRNIDISAVFGMEDKTIWNIVLSGDHSFVGTLMAHLDRVHSLMDGLSAMAKATHSVKFLKLDGTAKYSHWSFFSPFDVLKRFSCPTNRILFK